MGFKRSSSTFYQYAPRAGHSLDIIHMYAYTGLMDYLQTIKGRGAAENPPNRFEPIWKSRDPEWTEEDPAPGTLFLNDTSRSILSYNDSPDLGFNVSFNP